MRHHDFYIQCKFQNIMALSISQKLKECSDKITLKAYKRKEAAAAAQQHSSDHIRRIALNV